MIPRALTILVAVVCLEACRVDRVPFEVSGQYIAEYPQATEELTLLDSHTFHQVVRLKGSDRTLETSGRHAEAVRFCLSMQPGESNWAFYQFDGALTRWLAIDQGMMNRHRDAAFADVAKLPWVAPITALLVIALVFLALRPRLREYG